VVTISPSLYNRRGRQVFAYGNPWPSPNIGLGLSITEDVPPVVTGTVFPWLTFDRPGMEGRLCIDPGPNAGYKVEGGLLNLTAGSPGWPMITRQTFRKDRYCSVQWVAAVSKINPVAEAFHSAGMYNGELDYRTLDLANGSPGKLDLVILTEPYHTWSVVANDFCLEGGFHTFRVDHDGFGGWSYFVDDVLVRLDNSGPLKNDFHICIFNGNVNVTMGSITVNVED